MMKNGYLLLCATALSLACVSNQAQASINFNLKAPPILNVADRHTQHTPNLSAQSLSSPFSEKREIKVAQVCWITDTEDCGGADFVGTDLEGGTPPDVLPPGGGDADSCIKMGYDKTSCPTGYKPNKFCPLNNKYFAECIPDCPSDYKTCEPPLKGVGEVCGNDLYEDCCNPSCSAEYQYSLDEIPSGYEADGEPCKSCDGDLYKIKEKDCTGYLDCGDVGCEDGATTCQSGDTILCSECKKCPNLGTESECPPCTVCTYEECSNSYIITGCATGCTDWCAFNCATMGYKQQTCANTYVKCPIDTSYVYCLGN